MSEREAGRRARTLTAVRRRWMGFLGIGAALALVGVVPDVVLTDDDALVFFAVLLGMIPAVYFGFALNDQRARIIGAETLGALVYGGVAVLAITAKEPTLLGVGYIAHALWDAIHPHGLDTKMPWWYVPMCIGFDIPVGIYVLVRFA